MHQTWSNNQQTQNVRCQDQDMKSSHNTSACFKKQKEDKERKKGSNMGKTEKHEKPPTSRECKDCDRTITAPSLQTELSLGDNLTGDMEQLIHTIHNNNDPDIFECKDNYNKVLIHNKEVQTLHKILEDKIQIDKDEDKLKERKKNYNPTLEQIFNLTWDMSDSHNDDNIIKNLYKDL